MSKEHPDKPTSSPQKRATKDPTDSPAVDHGRLERRIEHLAAELEKSPIPARLDSRMLAQLDELRTLLREQRKELRQQATDADEMLKQCHDELARTDRTDLIQMREQQKADRQRDREDRRKRAA